MTRALVSTYYRPATWGQGIPSTYGADTLDYTTEWSEERAYIWGGSLLFSPAILGAIILDAAPTLEVCLDASPTAGVYCDVTPESKVYIQGV